MQGGTGALRASRTGRTGDYPMTWSNNEDYRPVRWIRLAGRWLKKAGFNMPSRIRVEVQEGKLVITHA
ncbi:hypothetical protein LMG29739_04372 [Paraburkholderia solisilvae]|uniref:Toxin SymE-like domain-containing protein n=1 Tax=Paraburkholderia solisilvae TaxID=624376 RepID=A0A6J5EH15_9BURK|nr:hypothetical protein LMG29739_04372 [Paraburkholderia solisilvae]